MAIPQRVQGALEQTSANWTEHTAHIGHTSNDTAILQNRNALPSRKRLQLLEQQINNIVQMHLPGRIDALSKAIQQLRGQLQAQAHQLDQLQKQLPTTQTVSAQQTDTQTSDAPNNPLQEQAGIHKPMQNANTALSSETQSYQRAFNHMLANDSKAIDAFCQFIQQYPTSPYLPNARYWLGDLYNQAGNTQAAITQFRLLIQNNPHHVKVPNAMLKLALIEKNQGSSAQAKTDLRTLISQFPQNPAAQLAKHNLQEMGP